MQSSCPVMVSLGQNTMRVPWILLLLAVSVPLEGRPLSRRHHGAALPENFRKVHGLNYFIHRYPSLHSHAAEYIPLEMDRVMDADTRRQMITAALNHFHFIVFNKTRPKPQYSNGRPQFPYPPLGAYLHTVNVRPPMETTTKPIEVHSGGHQESHDNYHGFLHTPKPTYLTASTTAPVLETTTKPIEVHSDGHQESHDNYHDFLHTPKPTFLTASTTVPVLYQTSRTPISETTIGANYDNLNTIFVDHDTETSTTVKSISDEVFIHPTNETEETHFEENPTFITGLINESNYDTTPSDLQTTTSIETTTSLNNNNTDASDFITSNEFINIISHYIQEFTTVEPEHSTTPTTESYDDSGAPATSQLQDFVTSEDFIQTVSQILNEATLKETTESSSEEESTAAPSEENWIENLQTTPSTPEITEDGSEFVTSVEFLYAVTEYMNEHIPETTQFDDTKLQAEGETTLTTTEIQNEDAVISEFIHILEENLNESKSENDTDGESLFEVSRPQETQIEIGFHSDDDQENTPHKEEDNGTESDEFPVISLPDEDLTLISNLFPVLHVDDAEIAAVVSEYNPSVYENFSEESTTNVSESKPDHDPVLLRPIGEITSGIVDGEDEIISTQPTRLSISFDTTFLDNDQYNFYSNYSTIEDTTQVTKPIESSSTENYAAYHTTIKDDTDTPIIELSTETVEDTNTDEDIFEEIFNIFDDQQENVTNAADVITGDYNQYVHFDETKADNYTEATTTVREEALTMQTTDAVTGNNLVSTGETRIDIASSTSTNEIMESYVNTEEIIKEGDTDQTTDYSALSPELTTNVIETTETTDFPTADIKGDWVPSTVNYGKETTETINDPIYDDAYDLVTAVSYIDETTLNRNGSLNFGSQISDVSGETTEIGYDTIASILEQPNESKVAKSVESTVDVFLDSQVFSGLGLLNASLESNNSISLNNSASNATHNIQGNVSDSAIQASSDTSNGTSLEERIGEGNSSATTTIRSETPGKWSLEIINETEPISDSKKLNSYPNISRFIDHFFKSFPEVSNGVSPSSEEPEIAANREKFNSSLEAKTESYIETTEALSSSRTEQVSNRNGKHYSFVETTEPYSTTTFNSKEEFNLPEHNSTSVIYGTETTTEMIYTITSIPLNNGDGTLVPEEDQSTTIFPSDEHEEIEDFDKMQQIRMSEMLMLIPALIQELQNGTMTAEEETIFHEMYGTLWPAIVAEAELNKLNDTHPTTTEAESNTLNDTDPTTTEAESNTLNDTDPTTTEAAHTISLPSQGRYRREASYLFFENDTQDLQKKENRRKNDNPNTNRSDRKLYGTSKDLDADLGDLDLQGSFADRGKLFKELSKEAWQMLSRGSRSFKINPYNYVKENSEFFDKINRFGLPTSTSDPDGRRRQENSSLFL